MNNRNNINSVITKKTNRGFSLVETLFYLAILVLILIVIGNTLYVISNSQERVNSARSIEQAASLSLDNIIRNLRMSKNLLNNSIFNENFSVLSIEKEDGENILFFVENGRLYFGVGEVVEPLTSNDIAVTRFEVHLLETPFSIAVKIEIDIESQMKDRTVSQTFYSTTLLRGSYMGK